jgi:hypothetical protein
MYIQTILAFLSSVLCLVAFISGLSFMCGRRGFRPLGEGGYSTGHQLTNFNTSSFQQQPSDPLYAKPLAVSRVMAANPVTATPNFKQQSHLQSGISGGTSHPSHILNQQPQINFLSGLNRTGGSNFRRP